MDPARRATLRSIRESTKPLSDRPLTVVERAVLGFLGYRKKDGDNVERRADPITARVVVGEIA